MELSSPQQLQTCFVRENGSTDPSNAHEVGRRLTRNGERAIGDCIQKPLALFFRESSLELRYQSRHGSRLFIRCEVTAGQPLDLETELAQSFLPIVPARGRPASIQTDLRRCRPPRTGTVRATAYHRHRIGRRTALGSKRSSKEMPEPSPRLHWPPYGQPLDIVPRDSNAGSADRHRPISQSLDRYWSTRQILYQWK
jgi:hypothetical protein